MNQPRPSPAPKKKNNSMGEAIPDTSRYHQLEPLSERSQPPRYVHKVRCFFLGSGGVDWIGIPNAYYCSLKVDAVSRNHKKHWGQKKTWVDTQNKEARPFFVFFRPLGHESSWYLPFFCFFFRPLGHESSWYLHKGHVFFNSWNWTADDEQPSVVFNDVFF